MTENFKNFCTWFCGFTDGEGCFHINKNKTGFSPEFRLSLRIDDVGILNEIQKRFNFGKVYLKKRKFREKYPNQKDNMVYCVWKIKDCFELINNIELGGGLKSKKKRDYEVWKEFIMFKMKNRFKVMLKERTQYEHNKCEELKSIRKFNNNLIH